MYDKISSTYDKKCLIEDVQESRNWKGDRILS